MESFDASTALVVTPLAVAAPSSATLNILPELNLSLDNTYDLGGETWYMEAIGPNGERGDIFLYKKKIEDNSFSYIGIILSMDTHSSATGEPCIFCEVESVSSKLLLGYELSFHRYSPISMEPSKNGVEGSMTVMGWKFQAFSTSMDDSGLLSCEDLIDGFKMIKERQLRSFIIPSSRSLGIHIKDALKGKKPQLLLSIEVFARRSTLLTIDNIKEYIALRQSGSLSSKGIRLDLVRKVQQSKSALKDDVSKSTSIKKSIGASQQHDINASKKKKDEPTAIRKRKVVEDAMKSTEVERRTKSRHEKDANKSTTISRLEKVVTEKAVGSSSLEQNSQTEVSHSDQSLVKLSLQTSKKELISKEGENWWSKFEHMYPFGMQCVFSVPVSLCDCAPAHMLYRPLNKHHLADLVQEFLHKTHSVDFIADIVPYETGSKRLLVTNEIKKENVLKMRYFIISGQHSISAARQLTELPSCPDHYLKAYKYRKCRILSAQEPENFVMLSKSMNDLHQKVMIKTPYQDALALARKQYEHFGCPPRPTGGHSAVNTKWKVSVII